MRVVASTALRAVLATPSAPARALEASDSALYVRLDDRAPAPRVVAVVAPSAVRLPVAMWSDEQLPPIRVSDAAMVGDGEVRFGDVRFRPLRWAELRPRLTGPISRPRLAAAASQLAALPPGARGLTGGVAIDEVAAGIVGGDATAALAIIGHGPGLTPAGGDAVAGVLAALALLGTPSPAATCAVFAHAAIIPRPTPHPPTSQSLGADTGRPGTGRAGER